MGLIRLWNRTMSRSYKIALILKSRSSLPVYRDLSKLSDRELDRPGHGDDPSHANERKRRDRPHEPARAHVQPQLRPLHCCADSRNASVQPAR